MRFVLAIVSFVVAAVMIGTGIAQQTILRPPSKVAASVTTDTSAPITIIDGATLNAFPSTQHLSIGGSSTVFAAYGRSDDVLAWVGDASYNKVSYDPSTKQLASTLVTGTEKTVPSPAGSDLWLQSYTDKLSLDVAVKVPATVSFIVVSNGTDPAPANVTLSWPMDASTPWAGPLLLGGGVVLIIGLILLLWAIVHLRASRGPRRRQPKMPKLPKQPRFKPAKRAKALPPGSGPSRSRRSARLTLLAAPVAALTVVALGGCSVDAVLPSIDATPAATSTPDGTVAAPPAVSEQQGDRIVKAIADVAAQADKSRSASTLQTRFTGTAAAVRLANYKMRGVDKSIKAIEAIPAGGVELLLPQQNEGWPRTVFAVVGDGKTVKDSTVQYALMLVQDDPRSNYKVQYAMRLANALPDLPVAADGTPRLAPDVSLLAYRPDTIAKAYGDVLLKDKKSSSYASFDIASDPIIGSLGLAAKTKRQKALPDTAKLTFSNAQGSGETIVMATLDGGAIVAVNLTETETVRPVESGASITNPKDVKALSGKATTTKGMAVTYGDQLLFFVPSATTPGPMKMLAYATTIQSAVEVKKK